MASNAAISLIEEQEWLDAASTAVQKEIGKFWKSGGPVLQKIKNALHGTWMGHPLHPVLTDIPTGAWTVAWILDILAEITGDERLENGADQSIAIGIAGAVAAAIAGITDWSDTDGKARNVGMMHAMLNTVALALYSGSYIARKQGDRQTGLWLAMIGAGVVTLAAYLGGHLVYEEQIGVDHTKGQPWPEKFTPVLAEDELKANKLTRVKAGDARILLVKQDGEIYAISEVCSHLGGPLAEGTLGDCDVTCPWHGSRFSLQDGSVLDGPTTHPAPCFKTRIRNGQIEVRLES